MQKPFDIAADLHTPVSAYLRLAPLSPRYLLESVEAGYQGRYSFIGFGDALRVDVESGGVYADGDLLSEDLLGGLRAALEKAPRCGPIMKGQPFSGGIVGASGFDLVRRLYPLSPAPFPATEPDGRYLATESILVFDHLTRRIAVLHSGTESEREGLRRSVISVLRSSVGIDDGSKSHGPPVPSMKKSDFLSGVDRVKDHITAGDVYQLVLSIKFAGETDIHPFAAYRALRLLNPSPYMYYVDFGDLQVVGSSPEALARLKGMSAELRPIAGTRPRGDDDEHDRSLERQLLADPKEAAEHVMLVDLARNDLGRTAVAGTIKVEPYRIIERYSHVMHMVSGVTGELRLGVDAFDLFSATFPAGTVSGAPKLRSIELIDELESVNRGLYSGSVGYFGHGGSMDQAITIRTIVFGEGSYNYQAGAGIVADSDPEREYLEVLSKGAAMAAAFDLAKEGL